MFEIAAAIFLGAYALGDLIQKQVWWPPAVLCLIAAGIGHFCIGDLEPISVLGGVGLGGMLFFLSWVTGEAIGYGDGLVVAACGALLGFWPVFELLFLAVLFSGLWSGILLIGKKVGKKDSFPFVPFLFAAQLCRMAVL